MNSLALINEFLGQPPNASSHGYQIDHILEFCHWFMAALFFGWSLYFIYVLIRFRKSRHPAADGGLIRQHDQAEPESPELAQGLSRTGDQSELVGPEHVPDLLVDRAVAVEQDEAATHEGLHTRPPACASTP